MRVKRVRGGGAIALGSFGGRQYGDDRTVCNCNCMVLEHRRARYDRDDPAGMDKRVDVGHRMRRFTAGSGRAITAHDSLIRRNRRLALINFAA